MEIRRWALEHPHDYALIYGTPIPGYAAPELTIVSGTRVSRALVQIVRGADRIEPAAHFEIDDVIDPAETRQIIGEALLMLIDKRERLQARPHDNTPL